MCLCSKNLLIIYGVAFISILPTWKQPERTEYVTLLQQQCQTDWKNTFEESSSILDFQILGQAPFVPGKPTWCCCWGRTGGPSVYHILPASRFLKSGFLEDFTLLVLPFSGVFYHQVHRTNHSPIIHSTTKYSEYQQINKQSIKHKQLNKLQTYYVYVYIHIYIQIKTHARTFYTATTTC